VARDSKVKNLLYVSVVILIRMLILIVIRRGLYTPSSSVLSYFMYTKYQASSNMLTMCDKMSRNVVLKMCHL